MAQKISLKEPTPRQITQVIEGGVVKLFRISEPGVYVHVIQDRSMVQLELGDSCSVAAGTLQIYLFNRDIYARGYSCDAFLLERGEPVPADA